MIRDHREGSADSAASGEAPRWSTRTRQRAPRTRPSCRAGWDRVGRARPPHASMKGAHTTTWPITSVVSRPGMPSRLNSIKAEGQSRQDKRRHEQAVKRSCERGGASERGLPLPPFRAEPTEPLSRWRCGARSGRHPDAARHRPSRILFQRIAGWGQAGRGWIGERGQQDEMRRRNQKQDRHRCQPEAWKGRPARAQSCRPSRFKLTSGSEALLPKAARPLPPDFDVRRSNSHEHVKERADGPA